MIKWLPLDTLTYTEANPNRGNVDVIYMSIASHGYVNVVHVWGDGIVKAGEHRLKALRKHQAEGYAPSERDICLRVDDDGAWEVMCIDVSAMSEQQANQLMLMFNQSARLGQDDIEQLVTLASAMQIKPEETFALVGFSSDEIALLSKAITPPDEFPEYDESLANSVSVSTCPECGHVFPA